MNAVINIPALRMLVTELKKNARDDEFGTVRLNEHGAHLTLTFGRNGEACSLNKQLTYDELSSLTVNMSEKIVRSMRHELLAQLDEEDEE